MPAEKRNHFLDVDESEDEGSQGYDSEAEQLRKGSSKRRKLDQDAGTDEDEPLSTDGDSDEDDRNDPKQNSEQEHEESTSKDPSTARGASDLADITRPLTKKNLVATEKAVKRSGVVYISRIPPFSECLGEMFLSLLPNTAHPTSPCTNYNLCSETWHSTVYL
jgi:ESF2/ABP1 family protein